MASAFRSEEDADRDDRPLRRAFEPVRDADDPIAEAEAAAEQREREAFQRGLEQGRREANEEAARLLEQEAERVRRQIAACVAEWSLWRERTEQAMRDGLASLTLEASRKILRRAVDAEEPLARRALDDALQALDRLPPLRVQAHADDLPSLREALPDSALRDTIVWEADGAMERGGCRVQCARGELDVSVEAGLSAIEAALGVVG